MSVTLITALLTEYFLQSHLSLADIKADIQ